MRAGGAWTALLAAGALAAASCAGPEAAPQRARPQRPARRTRRPRRPAKRPEPKPPEPKRPLPKSAHNLLLDARLSGNMAEFGQGVRGRPIDVVYDLQRCRFARWSPWHEYGVTKDADLGVVPEERAAYWIAEWPRPVSARLIRLSGAYRNPPQRRTAWKIEVRRDGQWRVLARGVGGWYHGGRFEWGGIDQEPLTFDAFRVSVFSKDARTPLRSVHFRGEQGFGWVVARVPRIDARIRLPAEVIRQGVPATLTAQAAAGTITAWTWDFGDGTTAEGRQVVHAFRTPRLHEIKLTFSDGVETASVLEHVRVRLPIEARITPLAEPVLAGRPVAFAGDGSLGNIDGYSWDFGDGTTATGAKVRHTFAKPGVYTVKLTVTDPTHIHDGLAIVRVHTPPTLGVPQVHLDTDPAGSIDDPHCLAYALLSELDVVAVNSVHRGGGQEAAGRAEIRKVLRLAAYSGRCGRPEPPVFAGADVRLAQPESGSCPETRPAETPASAALLASARGASPASPVWWVSVGPATNLASAILQARREKLDLKGRVRIVWLGGTPEGLTGHFNGNHDPWAAYVVARSGIETWVLPGPVAAAVTVREKFDARRYPTHPLGRHLLGLLPNGDAAEPLHDPCAVAVIISLRRGLKWVKRWQAVKAEFGTFRWKPAARSSVHLIRQIDAAAIRRDLFRTLAGRPTQLHDLPPSENPPR